MDLIKSSSTSGFGEKSPSKSLRHLAKKDKILSTVQDLAIELVTRGLAGEEVRGAAAKAKSISEEKRLTESTNCSLLILMFEL